MGNSVSQRDFQCEACNDLFEIHELIPIQLCANDYQYIGALLKGDALRGWSKKQIFAFLVFISFGSYYLGKRRSTEDQMLDEMPYNLRKSELKIRTLTNPGKDFHFSWFVILLVGIFNKK